MIQIIIALILIVIILVLAISLGFWASLFLLVVFGVFAGASYYLLRRLFSFGSNQNE
jgi:uncharacterized membrane protein